MKVLFRVDSLPHIGLGHIIRCRSLARMLSSYGCEIFFSSYINRSSFFNAFQEEFPVYHLETYSGISLDSFQSGWIPQSEIDDALSCLPVIDLIKPDWVVIDNYGISSVWHDCLLSKYPKTKIAVIDDLADRSHNAHLLIDHNLSSVDSSSRYASLLPNDSRLCLGPDYALIDPSYAHLSIGLPPRASLKRLLINLGGTCDQQLLYFILSTLYSRIVDYHLDVVLVTGPFATLTNENLLYIDELGIECHASLPSLGPLYCRSDLCISAGGTSLLERLCLGLPSLVFCIVDNQFQICQSLSQHSFIEYLGESSSFDAALLCESFDRFACDSHTLYNYSLRSSRLVDGDGCKRISLLMLLDFDKNLTYTTSIDQTSSSILLHFSNLTISNSASFTSKCISLLPGPVLLSDIYRSVSLGDFSNFYLNSVRSDCSQYYITVLSSPGSWMHRHIYQFLKTLLVMGFCVRFITDHRVLSSGDVCFILSYHRIISESFLKHHRFNLVVHASLLPLGKGWSPMTWQILESARRIPITLFEAVGDLDAGPIHMQQYVYLQGHELINEWQELQAASTIDMCLKWLSSYPNCFPISPQSGTSTFYERRIPKHSELHVDLSLRSQFNLLRVVDNVNYPAFFILHGRKYIVTITVDDSI